MSLGKQLRIAREKKGWTQVYVAKILGITSQTLSNYERGERDPDTPTLQRLAELYEVTTDYLLGHSDSPTIAELGKKGLEEFIDTYGWDALINFVLENRDKKDVMDITQPTKKDFDAFTEAEIPLKAERIHKDFLNIEDLDDESKEELRKYKEYLKVRQTLSPIRDETSAGLDSNDSTTGNKRKA